MDLNQLSVFCAIIAEKNMTSAAERLKVSQPTVSRHIKLLEEELGVALFDRKDRELLPTVQGQIFFGYAQKILNLAHKAAQSVQSLPPAPKGSIHIAALNYLGMTLMAPAISHFLKPDSDFCVRLSYGSVSEIIERMKKKEVDMVLMPDLREEYSLSLPYYESLLLFEDPILLVGSRKDHSLPEKITLADMGQKPFVYFLDMFPQFHLYLEKKKKDYDVQWKPFFEVNNLGTLKRMIEQGRCWGFMPAFSVQKQIQMGRLSAVQVEGIHYSMNVQVYYLQDLKHKEWMDALFLMLKKQADFSPYRQF